MGKEAGCEYVAGRWGWGGRETDRQTDRRAGAKKKRYQNDGVMHVHDVRP